MGQDHSVAETFTVNQLRYNQIINDIRLKLKLDGLDDNSKKLKLTDEIKKQPLSKLHKQILTTLAKVKSDTEPQFFTHDYKAIDDLQKDAYQILESNSIISLELKMIDDKRKILQKQIDEESAPTFRNEQEEANFQEKMKVMNRLAQIIEEVL